jgi:trigger factor
MKTQVENLEQCKAKLTIEFEQSDSSRAYSFVLKDLGKSIKVPGFVPGKVPKSIIEERVGKQTIEMRALEKLLTDTLPKALSEEKLDLISRPTLENSNFDFNDKLNVTLIVELRPVVKLGDYKNVSVQVPKSELKGVTVDTLLQDLAKQLAPWSEVAEDATVQNDDQVVMDFLGRFEDGSEMPDSEGKSIKLVVRPDNFAPNVIEQLIGTSVGQTKEIKTSFPADYENPEFAGKDAVFTVTVSKIERKVPLEINDELAVMAGQSNLETLKEALVAQIHRSKENVVRSRTQAAVLAQILEGSQVDLPDWLIEREAQTQMQSDHQSHNHADSSDCQHDHSNEKPSKELLEFSKSRLKFNLVLADISRNEKIQIDKNELTNYVQSWVRYRQMSDPTFAKNGNIPPGLVNHLSEELLFEKISDWLVNNAKVELVEESEENLKKLEDIKEAFPLLQQEG